MHPEEVGTGHHVIPWPDGHTHNNCIVITKLQNYSVQSQLSLIWICTVISIKSETCNQLYPTACKRNFAKRRWVWHLIQLFASTSYGCQVLSEWASVNPSIKSLVLPSWRPIWYLILLLSTVITGKLVMV